MVRSKEQGPSLVWPGKARHACRDVLPLSLHSAWGGERIGSWRDLLVHADNLPLLSTLIRGPLRRRINEAGGLKLVYIDPPFAVGADFTAALGGVNALAYRDTWDGGLSAFLSMMYERLLLIRELLAEDGSLYLHCDYRTAAHMRLLLEEVFGPKRFLGEIIWHYTGGGRAKRWFSRKHDILFHFARSSSWYFNPDAVRVPYKPTSGYARSGIVSARGKRYLPHPDGTPVDDVWDIPMINPLAAERTGYPTQKPEALLERIILASSRPGDLVADFFCGSGTAPVVAQRLGRRWLCADSGAMAVCTTRQRLMALPRPAPSFLLADLGASASSVGEERQGVFSHSVLLLAGRVRYAVSDILTRVTASGEGRRIELLGMRITVEMPDGLPGGQLPEDWTGWLDCWHVGVPCDDAPEGMIAVPCCNRVAWHSGSGPGRPLRSAELAPPVAARPAYAGRVGFTGYIVTLVDIFANICRIRVRI